MHGRNLLNLRNLIRVIVPVIIGNKLENALSPQNKFQVSMNALCYKMKPQLHNYPHPAIQTKPIMKTFSLCPNRNLCRLFVLHIKSKQQNVIYIFCTRIPSITWRYTAVNHNVCGFQFHMYKIIYIKSEMETIAIEANPPGAKYSNYGSY